MAVLAQDLRDAVLQVAFEGKLTSGQNGDSSIDELLSNINNWMNEQVSNKAMKPTKTDLSIKNDEIPFDVSNRWEWVRLGAVTFIKGGKRIPAGKKLSEIDTGHKYIRVSDMQNGTVLLDDIKYVPENIYEDIKQYTISKDDLYITVAGTIGRVGDIPEQLDGANLTENADKIVFEFINKAWLKHILQSAPIQNQIASLTKKVGQPKLALFRIEQLLIPLPPLEEQQRIVDRVEELMAKIDEYEAIENKLVALKKAFPQEMKDALLQAAMEGKLTETIDSDETVDGLVDRIKNHKNNLVKEGKIKREKKNKEVQIDEAPFVIRKTWRWCIVQDLFFAHSALRIHQSDWVTNGVPFFRGRELVKLANTGDPSPEIFITTEFYEYLKNKGGVPSKDDILITAVGTLGKVYVVKGDKPFYYKDAYILCLDNYGMNPHYIKSLIQSPYAQNYIYGDGAYGTTVAQLTLEKLKSFMIPIPPIQEQQRIVNKLETLLPLCDRLAELN